MECNNCQSLFNMIQALNNNVSSILTGYELLLNIVNDHEAQMSQVREKINDLNLNEYTNKKSNGMDIDNILSTEPCISNSEISSVNCTSTKLDEFVSNEIPVADNVDILSCLSNVEIIGEKFPENLDDTFPPSSNPKPTQSVIFPSWSDMSDISHISTDCDNDSCTKGDASIIDKNSSINNQTFSCNSFSSDSLIVPSSDPIPSSSLCCLPYEAHDKQIFNMFELCKLEDSTSFTHFFNNRSASYYGLFPYQYGNTVHSPHDFAENTYLQKILNYVDVVYPTLKYNSAMIHKYECGEHFIPFHSDNEDDIENNSLILTISFGETRTLQFNEVGEGCWEDFVKLHHGDSLLMSKHSQRYFKHGIPKESNKGKRLSITLRLIKPRKSMPKDIGIQTVPEDINDHITCDVPHGHDVTDGHDVPDGYQPDGFQEDDRETSLHSHTEPSYHESDRYQNAHKEATHKFRPSKLPKKTIDTLYISSSMFRFLDPYRLSSKEQNADVLFYPGADALQMMERLLEDPKFYSINKKEVTKLFVMVGTNNIDRIYDGSCSVSNAQSDINQFLYKLWIIFGNAKIHVINLLPRQNTVKNNIVWDINGFLEKLCDNFGLTFLNTEKTESSCFSHYDGVRNNLLFKNGYDNVHMSSKGYMIMARYLKYLAHS